MCAAEYKFDLKTAEGRIYPNWLVAEKYSRNALHLLCHWPPLLPYFGLALYRHLSTRKENIRLCASIALVYFSLEGLSPYKFLV